MINDALLVDFLSKYGNMRQVRPVAELNDFLMKSRTVEEKDDKVREFIV